MREYVYVSRRKVERFQPDRPQFGSSVSKALLTLKTPVAEVQVEGGPSSPTFQKRLRQVEKYLLTKAKWYTDESVQAGEWVSFEAKLATRTMSLRRDSSDDVVPDIVLFATVAYNSAVDEAAQSKNLILHGSADNLTQGAAFQLPVSDFPGHGWTTPIVFLASTAAGFLKYASSLPSLQQQDARRRYARHRVTDSIEERLRLDEVLYPILEKASEPLIAATAEWCAGLAHVSAVSPTVVAASPLYVERVSPPVET